jgi:chromate reductase
MITIVSGTNRKGSKTLQVANFYKKYLENRGVEHSLFSLENVDIFSRNEELVSIENKVIIPCPKFIFILPEYNGSFPGSIKTLIDNTDIRKCWWGKKALLTGVADGRGGNLRGLDHFTGILQYLKVNVHFNKLPLSKINEIMDASGNFTNEMTQQSIFDQIEGFIEY